MDDFSAIDAFLQTFITYIDGGFGLINGDVVSLASILILIDVTLAALFWAWGQHDILQSLVKKTLYVGAFAYVLGNFPMLSEAIYQSFAGLGLKASAAGFGPEDLMHPGLIAAEGMNASAPVFEQISQISPGPVEFFANIAEVVLLFTAGLIIIAAFFVMAIQLFVLIVEFKFTTLAGFALVPFAFWRQTSFLAERVLGNVMASGIKILVVAMIIGIGSTLFAQIRDALPDDGMNIAQAFSVVLGALVLMGLSIFCPRLAVGLVSGAPQLSAGAAAGTAIGLGAAGLVGAAAGAGAVRAGAAGTRAAAQAGGAVATATKVGSLQTGMKGPAAAPLNAAIGLGGAAINGARDWGARIAGHYQARAQAGSAGVFGASGGSTTQRRSAASSGPSSTSADQPDWARSFRRGQTVREGAMLTAHTLQSGDAGGGSEGPNLKERF